MTQVLPVDPRSQQKGEHATRAALDVEQATYDIAAKAVTEAGAVDSYRPRHLGKVIWWAMGKDTSKSESPIPPEELFPALNDDTEASSMTPEQVRAELNRLQQLREQLATMRAENPKLASNARLDVLFTTMARSMVVLQSLCGKLEELDSQEEELHRVHNEKLRKDMEHAIILNKQKTTQVIKTGISLFLSCVNIGGGIVACSTGVGAGVGLAMIAAGTAGALNTAADQLQIYEKACQRLGMDTETTEKTCRVLTRVTSAASWSFGALTMFLGGMGVAGEAVNAATKGFFAGSGAVGAAADGLAGARLAKITGEQISAEKDMLVLGQQFTEGNQTLQDLQGLNQSFLQVQQELVEFMAKIPDA